MNSGTINTTSEAARESISALIDNEADDLDLRRVLKESESGSEARQIWQRYHLASSFLKNEGSPFAGIDISEAVHAEVALEPAFSQRPAKSGWMGGGWKDLVAKGSIAAAVAFGVLVGVQQIPSSTMPGTLAGNPETLAETEPFVAPDLNSAVIPAGFDSPRLQARTVSTAQPHQGVPQAVGVRAVPEKESDNIVVNPELQAHLDRLMMIHAQQVSESSDLSVMSFARLTDLHALDEAGGAESTDSE